MTPARPPPMPARVGEDEVAGVAGRVLRGPPSGRARPCPPRTGGGPGGRAPSARPCRRRRRAAARSGRSGSRSRGRTSAGCPGRSRRRSRCSQTSACFSSGSRTITMSPRLAASATSSTSSPAASAFARLDESARRPTTTSYAGVLQVERVGVALGAVAEDRDRLALEEREVGVGVVEDSCQFMARRIYAARACPQRQRRRAEQLARRRARQLGDELEALRHLVAGERAGAVARRSSRCRSRAPSRSTTTAVTASCHSGSGAPDHRRVGDLGMARAAPPRPRPGTTFSPPVTIMSSSAALDVEEAVVVDPAEVAGVQPAVLVGDARARPSGPGRGSRRPGSAGGW